MTTITVKTYLPDGTESGEMNMNAESINGVNMLRKVLKLCKLSDKNGGTQTIAELENYFRKHFEFEIMALQCTEIRGSQKDADAVQKDAEKTLKLLQIVNPDFVPEQTPEKARANAFVEKVMHDVERISKEAEATEESEPEPMKGESTMKETTTNTAVQEVQAEPKKYTAEEIQTATGFKPEHVRISAVVWHHMDGTPYNTFRAAFVAGTSYKVPQKFMKSASAEICFTVVSNNGKTVKINSYAKYNGTITEETGKNKKLCPGSAGIWWSYDPETNQFSWAQSEFPVEFIQIDTIDMKNISRWAKNAHLSVIDCIPMTAEELEAWRADKGTATSNGNQQKRKEAHELDFTPVFYPVSEELARLHKEMISFDDYKQGKVTAEYQAQVSEVFELCRTSSDPEKSLYIANLYSKKLARWYDDYNRNGASCPSILICGAGNFPTRKKEKQNARYDTLMNQYNTIQGMKDKIKHPHGYEIRRQTITAEEFENVLYFETVINETENRIQLIFDGKPEEEERNILKKNGFRWSPRFKAWQRQLTENAVSAVWDVVKAFDNLEEAEAEQTARETESAKAEQKQNQQEEPETEALADWSDVEFSEIDGLPNPETLDLTETEPEPETIALKESDILDMLACLDKAKVKCTSAFYRGALKIMERLLANATGNKVYYDSIQRKHCFNGITADAQPTEAPQAEPETVPEQPAPQPTEPTAEPFTEDETKRFEVGKVYGTTSIVNSDCLFAFEVIKKSKCFVWLKDIHGDTTRRKLENRTFARYNASGQIEHITAESCTPMGTYSMSPVLDATDLIQDAKTAQEASDSHRKQLAEAEKARRQPKITQTINSDYVSEYVPF